MAAGEIIPKGRLTFGKPGHSFFEKGGRLRLILAETAVGTRFPGRPPAGA